MEDDLDNGDEVEVIYLDEAVEMLDDENFEEEADQPDVTDLAKLTYSEHTKSVFCGDLSEDGQMAATGGEDDSAYLWLTSNGETKLTCTGHKDSITSVCFNHDGQLLATGDMSGMIQVWDVKTYKLIWCYEGDDMEWLFWHPLTNVLISGTHSGEVYVWQIPQGNCKVLTSHGSSCSCGKLLPDGKHILTGYEDGQVKLWDIKTSTPKWQFSDPQVSNTTSIEINSDATLISIAPSSSLLKTSDGKSVGRLLVEGDEDIEVHKFSNELNLLITGSLSGRICVWDLHTQMIRHQAKLDYGVTTLKVGLNGKAFFGSTDGAIYVCDIRTGVLKEVLTGHKASVLSLCMSDSGGFILSTSDDKTAKIFSIQN